MFPPTAWVPVAPFPNEKAKVRPGEVASLILGIIGLCIHWVVFFRVGILLFIIPLVLSILAIIFGYIYVRKVLARDYQRKNGEGSVGLAGLSMGILTLMFTVAWLLMAQTYLWGWDL
jgi:tetrahydromethanopterin S-methyltransferase subunit C